MSNFVLAQEDTGGGGTTTLIFLGLMVAVFYFFIIRPQRQRQKAQQELSASLEIGDDVRTIGGIHGRILTIDEESVLLEVEQGQIRVARRAVGAKAGDAGAI
ncbi:MAG TPA: preprotein translocase subunit YajC [Acidimicrobiia bacterium]|nr:preprotein translocase subunit YajC [Acidimicrobiia bacterium]